jgi:hypothetical protein
MSALVLIVSLHETYACMGRSDVGINVFWLKVVYATNATR